MKGHVVEFSHGHLVGIDPAFWQFVLCLLIVVTAIVFVFAMPDKHSAEALAEDEEAGECIHHEF